MINVLIVLQSHSKSSASSAKRYCNAPKLEVSKRCTSSLVNTIKHCREKRPDVNYRLIIVDDHSDSEYLEFIKEITEVPTEIIHLETSGIMPSILKCYEIGKEQGKDLVYFAQDDYLYYETALSEMIDAYFQFSELSGKQVCIFPYDDPYRYQLMQYNYKVVLGDKRHWRNAYHTACCFMCSHQTVVENWDLFEAMGKSEYDAYCEDKSINRLFQNMQGFPEREINHLLFTPIPSLALHMGTETNKDPYLDWKSLWNQFEPKDKKKYVLPEGPIVVNVGSGTVKVIESNYKDDFELYKEVSVDIDPSLNPDIVASIDDLSQIPSESVEAVFSSHSLEHMFFHQVPTCINEWTRVLKQGGEVRIITPNLKAFASYLANGKIHTRLYEAPGFGDVGPIDVLYGHRASIARGREYMQHKTGFTKELMEDILSSLGYTKFQVIECNEELVTRIFK